MGSKGSATKQRILDAAEGLVLERGFAATSIDAIQDEAEISRGTFFYHFPSKDDLSKALISRYADLDREMVLAYMARAEKLVSEPLGQLLLFISLHEEMFDQMTKAFPGCLFASYAYEAGLFDNGTEDIVKGSLDLWRDIVGAKVQEVIAAQSSAPALDPIQVADHLYSVLQGAFIVSRVYDNNQVIVDQLHLVRLSIEKLFSVEDA